MMKPKVRVKLLSNGFELAIYLWHFRATTLLGNDISHVHHMASPRD